MIIVTSIKVVNFHRKKLSQEESFTGINFAGINFCGNKLLWLKKLLNVYAVKYLGSGHPQKFIPTKHIIFHNMAKNASK